MCPLWWFGALSTSAHGASRAQPCALSRGLMPEMPADPVCRVRSCGHLALFDPGASALESAPLNHTSMLSRAPPSAVRWLAPRASGTALRRASAVPRPSHAPRTALRPPLVASSYVVAWRPSTRVTRPFDHGVSGSLERRQVRRACERIGLPVVLVGDLSHAPPSALRCSTSVADRPMTPLTQTTSRLASLASGQL